MELHSRNDRLKDKFKCDLEVTRYIQAAINRAILENDIEYLMSSMKTVLNARKD